MLKSSLDCYFQIVMSGSSAGGRATNSFVRNLRTPNCFLMLSFVPLLSVAFQPQPAAPATRRAAIAGFASLVTPFAARAAVGDPGSNEGGALAATCLGFGCNPYGDLGYNGLSKEDAPPGSLPYADFLKAIKDKKVEGVVFQPPSGDVAFCIIDGKSQRIGEGWPVEVSNSWSSPTWVVRILENEGVPYAWNFDLKAKNKLKTGGKYEPYVPTYKTGITALDSANVKNGQTFGSQPKMYVHRISNRRPLRSYSTAQ